MVLQILTHISIKSQNQFLTFLRASQQEFIEELTDMVSRSMLQQFLINLLQVNNDKFILPLQYLLQSYEKQNPPILPKLAVPVKLINFVLKKHKTSSV